MGNIIAASGIEQTTLLGKTPGRLHGASVSPLSLLIYCISPYLTPHHLPLHITSISCLAVQLVNLILNLLDRTRKMDIDSDDSSSVSTESSVWLPGEKEAIGNLSTTLKWFVVT